MEWLAVGLPHNSSHLFARLPFADAVQLAALVGTGQMTWPEVNAALDAKIKLAISQLHARRSGRQVLAGPDEDWEQARRAGEGEIWARYHAKCDTVFADDTSSEATDPWSTETVRDRERRLNQLRDERDRALAALIARLGPQPPRRASTARQDQSAPTQLTAHERNALHKLDATGFVGSLSMKQAVHDLAEPLVEHSA